MTVLISVTLSLLGIICWMVADVHEERGNVALGYGFLFLAGGLICGSGYLAWAMVT